MMAVDRDLIPVLLVLLVPALLALWVRRPRRTPPVVYTMHPGPPPVPQPWGPEARTREQREADQARVNDAWGLR
jgi:hypothetical protein